MDQYFYNRLFEALRASINQNQAKLTEAICRQILAMHDPRNPNAGANHAQFYNFVIREAQPYMAANNGAISDDILFRIVTNYMSQVVDFIVRRGQQQPGYATYGQQTQGYPGGMMGGGMMGGFGTSTPDFMTTPSSSPTPQTPQPTPAAQPVATPSPVAPVATPYQGDIVVTPRSRNPLDNLPEDGDPFIPVETGDAWAGDYPLDRTIVAKLSVDLKTADSDACIKMVQAQHRIMENDPKEVVRAFFKTAPEELQAIPYLFEIFYNHLEIIDVPTHDFMSVQARLFDTLSNHTIHDPLHRVVINAVGNMFKLPSEAMDRYLTKAINRALHISCRKESNPSDFLEIGELSHLEELLSPKSQWIVTDIPDGRQHLKKIVENAIWNALSINTGVMFSSMNDVPVSVMRASPAFPFAMRGVYPDKDLIPNVGEREFEQFYSRLSAHVLSEKTFLVSRRAVVVTNIFGDGILNNITNRPIFHRGLVPGALTSLMTRFDTHQVTSSVTTEYRIKIDTSKSREERLAEYYVNDEDYDQDIPEHIPFPKTNGEMLGDLNIYAVKFAVDPEEYMAEIDLFSLMDGRPSNRGNVLALKEVRSLYR